MITMEQLQGYMQKAAQADNEKKFVNASGATLDDALREASVELGVGIKKIEYEVLEKGSSGVFGVGKRPWLIIAYPAQ
ncbi:MAG: Jag N-terminal domain-containing protein, partial [Alkalispirochaeta sp.]